MSIGTFLNGLTYNGKPITSNVDPTSGGMTQLNTPFLFGQVLQQASQPGGLLSDTNRSNLFANQVQGLIGNFRQGQAAQAAAMANAGVAPSIAQRILAQDPYQLAGQVRALDGGLQAQQSQNEFDALSALANATAQAASQQKQLDLYNYWQQKMYSQQKKAQGIGSLFSGASLLLGLAGLPLGGGTTLLGSILGSGIAGQGGGVGPAMGSYTPQGFGFTNYGGSFG